MARIKLQKDLFFNSDKYCCWITREKLSKGEKNSTIVENLSGYHHDIEGLLNGFSFKEVASKRDINSIKGLTEAVMEQTKINKEIGKAMGNYLEEVSKHEKEKGNTKKI